MGIAAGGEAELVLAGMPTPQQTLNQLNLAHGDKTKGRFLHAEFGNPSDRIGKAAAMAVEAAPQRADRRPQCGAGTERRAAQHGINGKPGNRARRCAASGADTELLERFRAKQVQAPLPLFDGKGVALEIVGPEAEQRQQIDPVPRVAGGAIFGGLIGAVSSIVNVVVDEFTGKDIGEHVLALLKEQTGLDGNGDSPTDIDGTIMLAGDVANPTEPKRTADPPVSAVSDHLAVLEWAQQEQHFMTALAMNPSVVDLAPEDGKERTVPNTEPLLADLDINPYRMSATLASAPSQTGLNISA